jgi:hypothetical protein
MDLVLGIIFSIQISFEFPFHPVELQQATIELQREMERFEKNCERFTEYQQSVITIAAVWNSWLIGQNKQPIENESV